MTAPSLLSPPPFPSPADVAVDRPTQRHLRNLYLSLRRGDLAGSTNVALATATSLRRVISGAKFTSIEDLNNTIRLTGAWLQEARRGEQAITNIVLRTLHLLSEESGALLEQSAEPSRSGSTILPPRKQASGTLTPSDPGSFFAQQGSGALSGSAFASPVASPGAIKPQRPPMYARDSTFFAHGSTFSISDLVAAGQNANSAGSLPGSSGFPSAANSGATTPALSSGLNTFSSLGRAAGKATGTDVPKDGPALTQSGTALDEADEEEGDDSEGEDSEEDDEDESDDDESSAPSAAKPANAFHLKPLLIQTIQELIDELETTRSNIARDARDHIHSGEIVLTLGHGPTVEAFLKQASRDRTFTLIVADSSSCDPAASYAAALPKSIKILSIPQSSIFTLLPRVTKVILSVHAVLANGGLLAAPGSAAATIAAKTHSTPVLVLAGLHKVCGDWQWVGIASSAHGTGAPGPALGSGAAGAQGTAPAAAATGGGDFGGSSSVALSESAPLAGDSKTQAPQAILPFERFLAGGQGSLVAGAEKGARVSEVLLNEWDYVEPDAVDVLITNTGEYPASYVYRLIAENFAE